MSIRFSKARHFAFNILGQDQQDISNHFADYRHHPKPPKLWGRPQEGCPILSNTLGWMVCKRKAIHKAGDHDIIVGEAVKLRKNGGHGEPLLYFHSRYRRIAD